MSRRGKIELELCDDAEATMTVVGGGGCPSVITDRWNLRKLFREVLVDRRTCIAWCQKAGLLPSKRKCPRNGRESMILAPTSRQYTGAACAIGLRFRCTRHNVTRSIADGTWFQLHNLSMEDVLFATYLFANETSYAKARREMRADRCVNISPESLTCIFKRCREVCAKRVKQAQEENGPLGGSDRVVEIDEMKFGKRKYDRGRWVEGTWIFGAIDARTKELRLEVCANNKRSKESLLPIIKRHVKAGSTIYSDCWRAYSTLNNEGFDHLSVNHTLAFVDQNTGANTQLIEAQWRPIRARLQRGGIRNDNVEAHLYEYMWRREVRRRGLDAFGTLVRDIREIYPGFGSSSSS